MGASRSGKSDQKIMTARGALELATIGGAAVLGRSDIGSLEPGKAADFTAINLNRIDYAGALHDPVAAVVFCAPVKVDYTVVGGKFVVKDGQLTSLDLPVQIEKHNQAAARLLNN
jgi:cytosine/adenosine deaminase-related metal-dependent hydrolase